MAVVLVPLALVILALSGGEGTASSSFARTSGVPPGTRVEPYLGGLDFPVDMAWVPGSKKIFFTEKNTGKVRVVRRGRLLTDPCVDLDVNNENERGALGIALGPNWRQEKRLYVYYTFDVDPNTAPPPINRVTRFDVVDDRCINPRHVVPSIPSPDSHHNGGQIQFVDDKLFVATGDGTPPQNAQNLSSLLGKVLRYKPGGAIPATNPYETDSGEPSPVWSYGHRNPFGLASRRGTDWLFESENGENCDDELNRIYPGTNYGWGVGYQCGTAGVGTDPEGPLMRWTPPIVPADLWWYEGRMAALSGDLYMAGFSSRSIYRFDLNDTGTEILSSEVTHEDPGLVVDVSKGPGGWLYFMTTGTIKRIVPE